MKLSDIPKHIVELKPPWFRQEFGKKYSTEKNFELDIEPFFHMDYYDGPLSGVFRYGGRYFYAKSVYGDDRCWWAVWEMTDEETEAELANHRLFEENVGGHTTYVKDEEGCYRRNLGLVKPRETWDNYYKNKDKPSADFEAIEKRDIFGIVENPFRPY